MKIRTNPESIVIVASIIKVNMICKLLQIYPPKMLYYIGSLAAAKRYDVIEDILLEIFIVLQSRVIVERTLSDIKKKKNNSNSSDGEFDKPEDEQEEDLEHFDISLKKKLDNITPISPPSSKTNFFIDDSNSPIEPLSSDSDSDVQGIKKDSYVDEVDLEDDFGNYWDNFYMEYMKHKDHIKLSQLIARGKERREKVKYKKEKEYNEDESDNDLEEFAAVMKDKIERLVIRHGEVGTIFTREHPSHTDNCSIEGNRPPSPSMQDDAAYQDEVNLHKFFTEKIKKIKEKLYKPYMSDRISEKANLIISCKYENIYNVILDILQFLPSIHYEMLTFGNFDKLVTIFNTHTTWTSEIVYDEEIHNFIYDDHITYHNFEVKMCKSDEYHMYQLGLRYRSDKENEDVNNNENKKDDQDKGDNDNVNSNENNDVKDDRNKDDRNNRKMRAERFGLRFRSINEDKLDYWLDRKLTSNIHDTQFVDPDYRVEDDMPNMESKTTEDMKRINDEFEKYLSERQFTV